MNKDTLVLTCNCGCGTTLLLKKLSWPNEDVDYLYLTVLEPRNFQDSLYTQVKNWKSGLVGEIILDEEDKNTLDNFSRGYSSSLVEFDCVHDIDGKKWAIYIYNKEKISFKKRYLLYEMELTKIN